jgi:hypothetical protein
MVDMLETAVIIILTLRQIIFSISHTQLAVSPLNLQLFVQHTQNVNLRH